MGGVSGKSSLKGNKRSHEKESPAGKKRHRRGKDVARESLKTGDRYAIIRGSKRRETYLQGKEGGDRPKISTDRKHQGYQKPFKGRGGSFEHVRYAKETARKETRKEKEGREHLHGQIETSCEWKRRTHLPIAVQEEQ